MKGVQSNGELDEADLDDVVRHSRITCLIISAAHGFIGQQGQRTARTRLRGTSEDRKGCEIQGDLVPTPLSVRTVLILLSG